VANNRQINQLAQFAFYLSAVNDEKERFCTHAQPLLIHLIDNGLIVKNYITIQALTPKPIGCAVFCIA
jgi:hypothetical protein